MDLAEQSHLEQLLRDAALLLGVEQGMFNELRATTQVKPPEPRKLEKGNDLAQLVRDLLVKTVGMGVEL